MHLQKVNQYPKMQNKLTFILFSLRHFYLEGLLFTFSNLGNSFKGIVRRDFRFQGFFSWMSFPKPLSIIYGLFRVFFWKFGEIFAARGAPTVSLTMANSPRVSMTSVITYFSKITFIAGTLAVNWRRCQQHRYYKMKTLPDCLQLKLNK